MPDRQWLDGYSDESIDDLISLEGSYRTDSLVMALAQALDQKSERLGENTLTYEERVILAIDTLEREVNNGGYGQLFVNSSCVYISLIIEALRQIDCPKTAEITHEALLAVQRHPLTDMEIQYGTWENHVDRQEILAECDSLYFGRPENIEESLFAHIKANRTKIQL